MRSVRAAITSAGFDVFFDQGTAWFASDHQTSTFSVSVTRATPALVTNEGPTLATINGTAIRGYWDFRIAWKAGEYTWWLEPQGAPPEDQRPVPWHLRLPRGDVLGRLVAASAVTPQ